MKKYFIVFLLAILFSLLPSVMANESNSIVTISDNITKVSGESLDLKIRNNKSQKFILSSSVKIDFDSYNYYNIKSGLNDFIVADVYDADTDNEICTLMIDINSYKIHIHYFDRSINAYHIYQYNMNESELEYFLSKLNGISITDTINERLNSSLNAYSIFVSNNNTVKNDIVTSMTIEEDLLLSAMSIGCTSEFCLADDPGDPTDVSIEYLMSSLTDEDTYLDQYLLSFQSGIISDDDIVDIVPKEAFFEIGETLYLGEEYGIYINTSLDYLYAEYYSDVLVFDISVILHSESATDVAELKISPIISYRYASITKDYYDDNIAYGMWTTEYSSSISSVVYPHTDYNSDNIFIADVGFRYSIKNATEPNYEDNDYYVYSDIGEYIHQARYSFLGITSVAYNGSFLEDTVNFAFGAVVPYSGVSTYLVKSITSINNGSYGLSLKTETFNTDDFIVDFPANFSSHITYNGGYLVKTANVSIESNSELLLFDMGNYASAKFSTNYQGSITDDSKVNYAINIKIVRANSTYNIFSLEVSTSIIELEEGNESFPVYIYN